MYGHTYSKSMDQPGKVASAFVPENLVSRDGFGSPIPCISTIIIIPSLHDMRASSAIPVVSGVFFSTLFQLLVYLPTTPPVLLTCYNMTINITTPYQEWVWEIEAHINWPVVTCQGSTRLELP